jgi:hypothetical protein
MRRTGTIRRMGLLNKKNINKAKSLFDKNKGKIAPAVNKATDAIDKKTGGKYADKLKKVDDAATKMAAKPADPPKS